MREAGQARRPDGHIAAVPPAPMALTRVSSVARTRSAGVAASGAPVMETSIAPW
jgi:hypothetical protein